MSTVFAKLDLKDQSEIVVFNIPASFEPELKALKDVAVVCNPKKPRSIRFALGFATNQIELDRLSKVLAAASEGDAVLWFAYPKGTSRRYTCDFNRDSDWQVIREAGFDSVRQIAIDEDWSALRFRRMEYIKPTKPR